MRTPRLLNAPTPTSSLDNIGTLVLDCDEVLCQGDALIPGAKETLFNVCFGEASKRRRRHIAHSCEKPGTPSTTKHTQ